MNFTKNLNLRTRLALGFGLVLMLRAVTDGLKQSRGNYDAAEEMLGRVFSTEADVGDKEKTLFAASGN